ncbi:ABC transporter permease [Chloroflexota bacterium]
MATVISLIVLWEATVKILAIPTYILPAPALVMRSLVEDIGVLLPNALFTMGEILLGFALSAGLGIAAAIVIACWPIAEKTLYPILVGLQMLPKIALAPLFVMWLGFGYLPKVLIIVLIASFPIVLNTVSGIRSVETEKLYLLQSMGASGLQTFLKVRFPSALPSIFTGLKIASTLAVIGAIVGEFIAADRGLGRILILSNASLDTPLLFAGVVLLSIMGFLLYSVIELSERVLVHWHGSNRARQQ